MHVNEIMSQPVVTAPTKCTLDAAARLMWEFDCGIVQIVGDDGRLAGVITDRDICMAARPWQPSERHGAATPPRMGCEPSQERSA